LLNKTVESDTGVKLINIHKYVCLLCVYTHSFIHQVTAKIVEYKKIECLTTVLK